MMDKATYTPPQISVLGTLEELTLGTGAALSDNCALTPAPIANAPSPVDPCGKP